MPSAGTAVSATIRSPSSRSCWSRRRSTTRKTTPSWTRFLHDDRRGRTIHSSSPAPRPAVVLAGVPERPALGVLLHWVVEVGLSDVLRAAGRRAANPGFCVVAFLGSDVNRHGGSPNGRVWRSMAEPPGPRRSRSWWHSHQDLLVGVASDASAPEGASSVAPVVHSLPGLPAILASQRASHPGDEQRSTSPSLRRFPPVLIRRKVGSRSSPTAPGAIERVSRTWPAGGSHASARWRATGGLAALCYFGANIVPSGIGCEAFADRLRLAGHDDHRPGARRERPLERRGIGDAQAARRPAGPTRLRPRRAAAAGATGLREAKLDDVDLLLPACAATHYEARDRPAPARRCGFSPAHDRTDRGRAIVAPGPRRDDLLFRPEASGLDAAGRPAPAGLGVDPGGAKAGTAESAGSATSAGSCSRRRQQSRYSSGPRTRPRSVSTSRPACVRSLPTGASFSDLVAQCY